MEAAGPSGRYFVERVGELFINDTDRAWPETLYINNPMIAAVVILLLAILFSLAWRGPGQSGIESNPTGETHQRDEHGAAKAIRD